MAALNIDCPTHGQASERNTVSTKEGKGMVMNFTFPCCDMVIAVTTGRAGTGPSGANSLPLDVARLSGAVRDASPMVPTQRTSEYHQQS